MLRFIVHVFIDDGLPGEYEVLAGDRLQAERIVRERVLHDGYESCRVQHIGQLTGVRSSTRPGIVQYTIWLRCIECGWTGPNFEHHQCAR